jgi:diaminopimelate epimerase
MITITKAHAYGNDFLLVPAQDVRGRDRAALARALCGRHTGIGADGLLLFETAADRTSMQLFNADGSPSELSGNGLRCLAAVVIRNVAPTLEKVRVQTDAGEKVLTLIEARGNRYTFRAAMGQPGDLRELELEAAGEQIASVAMTMGNPQCVVLGGGIDDVRFERLGPALATHPAFPAGTNVEFAQILGPDRVEIRIWERGVGPTSSSGTGSCASAVAAAAYGGASRDVLVTAPGGTQRVEWTRDGVYLTGWAEIVLEGHWVE